VWVESFLAQHPEVVRERRDADAADPVERRARVFVAIAEPAHELEAGRIAERVEDVDEPKLADGWL
jgi:hypothetical protein